MAKSKTKSLMSVPPCLASMGCLCALHARGGDVSQACDASEDGYNRDESTCCGNPLRFDPAKRGETCGGLVLVGWMGCDTCGGWYLAPKGMSREDDGTLGPWALAKGGRSVHAGSLKVRVEGKGKSAAIAALMRRLVLVPELEVLARAAEDTVRDLGLPADHPLRIAFEAFDSRVAEIGEELARASDREQAQSRSPWVLSARLDGCDRRMALSRQGFGDPRPGRKASP